MARYKTVDEIKNMCEEASKDMNSFYKAKCVNYKGKTKEKVLYTEVIAEWLLKNVKKLKEIESVRRELSYNPKHKGKLGRGDKDSEKNIAIRIFNQKCYNDGLLIIDYQIPLNNHRADKRGEIDLLALNEKEKCVYIFELKKEKSKESMLRCVIEGYTYLKTICKEKLLNDFGIDGSYSLKTAPLVFEGGTQYDEFMDKNRGFLHELMKKLGIVPFFLSKDAESKFVISKIKNKHEKSINTRKLL